MKRVKEGEKRRRKRKGECSALFLFSSFASLAFYFVVFRPEKAARAEEQRICARSLDPTRRFGRRRRRRRPSDQGEIRSGPTLTPPPRTTDKGDVQGPLRFARDLTTS